MQKLCQMGTAIEGKTGSEVAGAAKLIGPQNQVKFFHADKTADVTEKFAKIQGISALSRHHLLSFSESRYN